MTSAPAALEQFVRSIPLFSLVAPSEMMDILRLLRPVQLSSGQVLFKEGDPGKAMWVLGRGTEVSISSTAGGQRKNVVVAYAKSGEVIGEMALVDDGARSGTATVTQEGLAHEIDAMEFHALRDAFQPAAFKVLRQICIDLCKRLRATSERVVPSSQNALPKAPLPASSKATAETLDLFAPFKPLPAVVKLALAQKLEFIEVHEVTPLFGEGEDSDGTWFLVEGEVSVGRNGKTLANLVPGNLFGLVSAIDAGKRSASCVTTGPAKLLKLSDHDFDLLFASGHRFAFQIVDLVARQLVGHLRQTNAMVPALGKRSPNTPVPTAPMTSLLATPPGEMSESDLDLIPLELEIDVDEAVITGEIVG